MNSFRLFWLPDDVVPQIGAIASGPPWFACLISLRFARRRPVTKPWLVPQNRFGDINEVRSLRLLHAGRPFAGAGHRGRQDRMGHAHTVRPYGESGDADRSLPLY